MPDEKGQISLEENTNSIIVKANRMTLDYFDKIIAELDEMPLQVLVEAQIIELDLNKDRTVGSNPGYSHNTNNFIRAKGLATDYTSGTTGMFAQLLSGKWAVTIQALQTAKKAKTLANPKILTLNHKEAKIITGEKLGYYTSTTTQTSTVQNVDFLEVGTKLTFIPHVSEDGYIMMEIKPEVSAGDIVNGLPQKQTTETDTKILVKDGQTIVISGLIKIEKSRNETGIPILSDIPLLGSFFRKSIHKNDKSEIIVLITPHILYDTEQDWMIQSVEETKTKMNQINPSFIH